MSDTVRIYEKEQISASNFCIPDNMDAEVIVPVGEGLAATSLKFVLRFDSGDGTKGTSSWENINGVVKFTFRDWTAVGGAAFTEPFRIGDVGGVGLFVQIAHYRIGTLNHVNWFVLVGGK